MAIALGLATALSYEPSTTLAVVGGVIVLTVLLFAMKTFSLSQQLLFIALSGFVVLGYGFANWVLVPSVPIPVGHLLVLAALVLAASSREREVFAFLREPAVLWWLLLVGLSVAHLVFDIPRYMAYAVRDASFVVEGMFMLLGFLWARNVTDTKSVLTALAFVFLLNTVYSLTYPISDSLVAISPVSGIFQRVPLLGIYSQAPLFLVAGALYCLLVLPHLRAWPRGLTFVLAGLQAAWSFVFQARSVYIGTAIALVLLVLLGGPRRGGKAAAVLLGSLVVFFLIIGITGSAIQGRIGEVGPDFLWQHVRSLLLDPSAPAEGTVQWRVDLLPQLQQRWTASGSVMAIGEGFGQPLIEFENALNVVVRQPHNTHITVLIRLGALGFLIWLLMHWRILSGLLRFVRTSGRAVAYRDLALWLFLFYVLGLVFTTFQPWLEFSSGAIPYYVLVGFALRMSRENTRTEPLV